MRLDYGLFMAEAEGHLDTRESKIQKLINEFVSAHKMGFDINYKPIQDDLYEKCGIDYLNESECRRIKHAVEIRI